MRALLKYIVSLLFLWSALHAQDEKKQLREGNKAYQSGKYEDAAKQYESALKKNTNYKKAYYNLGTAKYKSLADKKHDADFRAMYGAKADSILAQQYRDAAGNLDIFANGGTSSKDSAHSALHNMGNAYLMAKDYQKAIDAYKKSLKYDSKDEDTRYNLAYAQRKLKEQQEKDKQNKDKQDDKNQNKEDQQKNQKQELKDKKDQQQQAQPKLSKEDAQRMLDALKQAEKKLQDGKKVKGNPIEQKQIEKDW